MTLIEEQQQRQSIEIYENAYRILGANGRPVGKGLNSKTPLPDGEALIIQVKAQIFAEGLYVRVMRPNDDMYLVVTPEGRNYELHKRRGGDHTEPARPERVEMFHGLTQATETSLLGGQP